MVKVPGVELNVNFAFNKKEELEGYKMYLKKPVLLSDEFAKILKGEQLLLENNDSTATRIVARSGLDKDDICNTMEQMSKRNNYRLGEK